jgi:hypothetical protein
MDCAQICKCCRKKTEAEKRSVKEKKEQKEKEGPSPLDSAMNSTTVGFIY